MEIGRKYRWDNFCEELRDFENDEDDETNEVNEPPGPEIEISLPKRVLAFSSAKLLKLLGKNRKKN